MNKIFATFIGSCFYILSYAQVGIGTITPNQSAALDITDTTKGLLIPRITMAKKNAIANPAQGLLAYQTDSSKGLWYFDGTAWKNINASSTFGGEQTIVLSDTITNSQAVTKLATEIGPNTQHLIIQGCLYLTTIDLSMFTNIVGINISDNPVLQAVNLQNLKSCEGYFRLNNCPALNNLNTASLERILYAGDPSSFYINNVGLANLNFPKLKRLLGNVVITNNPYLKTVSFPLVPLNLGFINISYNPALLTVSFPLVQSMFIAQCSGNGSLTSMSFPSLTTITSTAYNLPFYIGDHLALTSLLFGNLTSFKPTQFFMVNTRLSSASVNSLLHSFTTITPPMTGKYLSLQQVPPAPPTGQGLADKAMLIANGNTVITD